MTKPERIDAATLKASLDLLEWSATDAARELGVASNQRVNEWLRGARPVPRYVGVALAHRVDQLLRKRGL